MTLRNPHNCWMACVPLWPSTQASLESEPFGLNYKESEPRHDLSAARELDIPFITSSRNVHEHHCYSVLRDMGCLTFFESVALRCLREEVKSCPSVVTLWITHAYKCFAQANVSDILREQRSTSLENTLGLLFAEEWADQTCSSTDAPSLPLILQCSGRAHNVDTCHWWRWGQSFIYRTCTVPLVTPYIKPSTQLTDQPLALFQAGQFTEVPTIMVSGSVIFLWHLTHSHPIYGIHNCSWGVEIEIGYFDFRELPVVKRSLTYMGFLIKW